MHRPGIAYFVSPHGFGHAARSAAIVAALRERAPSTRVELFTGVPAWFFEDSLGGAFAYHSVATDVGLVQAGPLVEDLPATVRRLDAFLPFDPSLVEGLARRVVDAGCGLVACDISPLGIAVARAAGLPSVLVENFTWDWIYEGYRVREPEIGRFVRPFRELFEAATWRVKTEPYCVLEHADLVTRPVSRAPRSSRAEVRERLGVDGAARVVLVTMGGIQGRYDLRPLEAHADVVFVVPGAAEEACVRRNLVLLPHRSAFYHPDLVGASDAVVGKLGYSTVAEAYYAGIPFGYVQRPLFRESSALAAFVEETMHGIELPGSDFGTGGWAARVPELLALPRDRRDHPNGAHHVAEFLHDLLRAESRVR